MLSAGEVGVIFGVKDEASAALQRIADEFNKIQLIVDSVTAAIDKIGGADGGLLKLQEALGLTAKSGEDAAASITESFGKVDVAVKTAADGVNLLKTSFMEAAEAARAINVAAANIGGGGGFHSSGTSQGGQGEGWNPRVNGQQLHPHAGQFSVTGLGPWYVETPIAAVGYGIKESMSVQDKIADSIIAAQVPPEEREAAQQSLMDRVTRASRKNGFSPDKIASAYLGSDYELGGLSFDKRMELEETLMPYAAAESRLKGTDLPDSMKAIVGMAHMFGVYEPEQIKQMAPQFVYASSITPVTLPQFQRAVSYPAILQSELGMDPGSIMFQTAMMQASGIMNTRSGTWLRSFWQKMEPSTGDSKADTIHNAALHKLGLIDDDNKETWSVKGADGKTDWGQTMAGVSGKIGEALSKMDPADRVSTLHDAWGAQGGGYGALMNLPGFVDQLVKQHDNMMKFQTSGQGENVITDLTKMSPQQQLRMATADFQTTLMEIGTTTMPAVTASLKGFEAVMKGIFDWSPNGPNKNLIEAWDKVHGVMDKPFVGGSPHTIEGRDPRSPQTGPYAYYPPSIAAAGNSGPHGLAMIPNEPSIAAHAASMAAPPADVTVQPALTVTTLPVSITVTTAVCSAP